MSTALYLRRPGASEKHLYVIGGISEGEGARVLCVTTDHGAKTLPVFSNREAARRFLRALRFNLFGSEWRTRRISESEAGSLLARPPEGIQGITLDPSPETLVGECAVGYLAEVT